MIRQLANMPALRWTEFGRIRAASLLVEFKDRITPCALRMAMTAVIAFGILRPCLGQQTPPAAVKTSPPPAVAGEAVQRAITNLNSPNFAVRDKAVQQLWHAGAAAQSALEKVVAESDNFDAVFRARQILSSFRLGIYPDTPPETAALISRFHLGNLYVKEQIAQQLSSSGKRDLLRKLIDLEPNRSMRDQLRRRFSSTQSGAGLIVESSDPFGTAPAAKAPDVGAEARQRLAERNVAGAERLLRDSSDGSALRDYAALLLVQNKLAAEIAQLRGKLKPLDFAGQRKLAWLLRANGDLPAAIAAARAAKDHALLESLLAEACDWKELAKIDAQADVAGLASSSGGGSRLARIIVVRHLAGDKAGCDAAIAAAAKAVKANAREPLDSRALLGPLVVSDRVDACVELLAPASPQLAFNLLVGQDRLNEAFRLAKVDIRDAAKTDWAAWLKSGNDSVSSERIWLAQSVAKALHAMGEDQPAQDLLAAIANDVVQNRKTAFRLGLIETAVELDDTKKTDALAAQLIAKDGDIAAETLKEMYGEQGELAVVLWRARREQFPAEETPLALRNLRRLFAPKRDAALLDELRRLAQRAEQLIVSRLAIRPLDEAGRDDRARGLLALAALFHRCNDSKLTDQYLRRIGTSRLLSERTLIDQGNLYAEEKLWDRAVRAYSAAFTKNRRNAAALYLLGYAQVKQGNDSLGAKNKELALMLPLGDGESRIELIRALVRLHENEEAARQRQVLLRTADCDDRALVQTLWEIGEAVSPPKDGPPPAAAVERTMVLFSRSGIFLPEVRYYLNVAYSLHRARALALLNSGKTADAIDELHRAEAIMPVNVQLSLDCDALLRKQGAAAEADALYRRMADRLQNDCREYSRSAGCRNDFAWLAANLGRDLDMALANAQRAVELDPQSAGVLDTLAEVHYRRGNRAEAVRLCKQCIEMDGERTLYKERLARFEK
jgi:hypothetical protein